MLLGLVLLFVFWAPRIVAEQKGSLSMIRIQEETRRGRSLSQLCQAYGDKILVYYDELYWVTRGPDCQRRFLDSSTTSNYLVPKKKVLGVDATIIQAIPRGPSLGLKEVVKMISPHLIQNVCAKYEGKYVANAEGRLSRIEKCAIRPVLSPVESAQALQRNIPLVLSPFELELLKDSAPVVRSSEDEAYWDQMQIVFQSPYRRYEFLPPSTRPQQDDLAYHAARIQQYEKTSQARDICTRARGHYVLFFEDFFYLNSVCQLEPVEVNLQFFYKLEKSGKKVVPITRDEFLKLSIRSSSH